MSVIGSSANNAAVESFNTTLKGQLLQDRAGWSDEREARLAVFCGAHRYITVRRHSRLGYRNPIATRTR